MVVVKEFEKFGPDGSKITQHEFDDLKDFVLENKRKKPVLTLENDYLRAHNYVGIIETNKKTSVEILPKIDLSNSEDNIKKIFLQMLRPYRGAPLEQLNQSNIRALHHYNMLDVFIRLFLNELILLTQRGLARSYITLVS